MKVSLGDSNLRLVLLSILELRLTNIYTTIAVLEVQITVPVLTRVFLDGGQQENAIKVLYDVLSIFLEGLTQPVEDQPVLLIWYAHQVVQSAGFVL